MYTWTGKLMGNYSDFKGNSTKSSLNNKQLNIIVFVNDIGTLDDYLRGPVKYPFRSSSSNYLLLIGESSGDNFIDIVGSILSRLWFDYGILRVLVMMSVCSINMETQVFE